MEERQHGCDSKEDAIHDAESETSFKHAALLIRAEV